jgi:two-component sensor histidine kinase/CheY-like chemotaxis protein
MAELDHRVKNTIANIQALVRQTSRSAESVTSFVAGLEGRIRSMGKAHSLLSQSRWESVSLTRLIHEELDAYGTSGTDLTLNGDELLLTPKSALSLSLAIHELATNAVKYGSLSISGGSVSVGWQVVESGIDISWTEVGGPPVSVPSVVGFGTTLIEKALAMETGGKSKIEYLPDGIVCKIFLPEAALSKTRAAVQGELDALPKIHEVPDPLKEDFRILVVEDSFLVVTSIEEFFNELGWTIVGPASRKDVALKLARSERFDAALLDINLNGEMSWDIAAVLQERGIPFVFSTGYDSSSILPDFLVGSVVLGKPLLEDELARRLRKCIAAMRAQAVIT